MVYDGCEMYVLTIRGVWMKLIYTVTVCNNYIVYVVAYREVKIKLYTTTVYVVTCKKELIKCM